MQTTDLAEVQVLNSRGAYLCIQTCRGAANPEDAAIPWDAFPIGGVTAGAVHAHEEFGVTVDLLADENVVGLISPGQVPFRSRMERVYLMFTFVGTCTCRIARPD